MMMNKKFHDVEIYSGSVLATTGSRLEIGARNKFLLDIFTGLADCARCREPLAIIFAEEEENTLREVFNKLSHFKTSAFSLVESKSLLIESILVSKLYTSDPGKVDSLLERLRLMEMSRTSSGDTVTRLSAQTGMISDEGREEETQQVEMDTRGEP